MLVEKPANVARECPVFGLPGRVKRSGSLLVSMAYLLPAGFAFGDKRRKLGLTARNGDGLFVGTIPARGLQYLEGVKVTEGLNLLGRGRRLRPQAAPRSG